jgi:AhpC/TSA family
LVRALILALFLVSQASAAQAALGRVEIGDVAPGFSALGSDGRQHALSDYAGKIVVLEWTSPVCPYTALKYRRGLMQAIQGRAARAGVVWLSINTSPPGRPGHLSVESAKTRLTETGAKATSLILDEDTRIGLAYGVRTTPTVFIIGKDGRLAYQGAVDSDPQKTRDNGRDYVTAALRDLKSGGPVKRPQTRAYGCAVEY